MSTSWYSFKVNEVFKADHQLKADEKDFDGLFSSEAIINTPIAINELLEFSILLINVSIAHDHVPPN